MSAFLYAATQSFCEARRGPQSFYVDLARLAAQVRVDLRDEALAHVGEHLREQLVRVGDERAVAPLHKVVVYLRRRGRVHVAKAGRQLLVELRKADEESYPCKG